MREIFYNRASIQKLLHTRALALRKRWGQNFLVNKELAERIAAQAFAACHNQKDQGAALRIWEIGPGLGSLTAQLLEKNTELTVFEIDYGLIRFLQEEFSLEIAEQRLKVVAGDAEKTVLKRAEFLEAAQAPGLICGNLPYRSAVRIILSLCTLPMLCVPAVYMAQKEAVERLLSEPGSSQYGVSSVLVQAHYQLRKLSTVSAASFFPTPHVESLLFECVPKRHSHPGRDTGRILQNVVRAAFGQRRKKISNTLLPFLHAAAQHSSWNPEELLTLCSMRQEQRAEEISVENYVKLASYLAKKA